MNERAICIVTPDFPGPIKNGGVGSACLGYALSLVDAGYKVEILFTGPTQNGSAKEWISYYERNHALKYQDLNQWRSKCEVPRKNYFFSTDALLVSQEVLDYLKSNNRYSIVFFQDYLGNGFRFLQAKQTTKYFCSTKTVVITHSCTKWIRQGMRTLPYYTDESVISFMEASSIRLADWVMHPCDYMKSWITLNLSKPAREIVVPYQTTLHDRKSPLEKLTEAGPLDIVFFGRLETRKGLAVFLEAVENLSVTDALRSVHFLGKEARLYGSEALTKIKETLRRSGIVDYDIRTDLGTESALNYVAHLKNPLVVLPSLVDNMPLAVIELFERHFPIIVSNVGGIPEIVGTSNQEILFDPDGESLTNVITKVFKNGYPRIDRTGGFNSSKSKEKLITFMEEICNSAHSSINDEICESAEQTPLSIIIAHRDNLLQLTRVISIILPQLEECDEIIVVDDCSTELVQSRLGSMASSLADKLKVINMPVNVKPAKARNIGVEAAKNAYVIFFDSDNEPSSNMVRDYKYALSVCHFNIITSYNQTRKAKKSDLTGEKELNTMIYNPLGGCLSEGLVKNTFGDVVFGIERTLFQDLGGFDSESCVEDWSFLLKATIKGYKIGLIPFITYFYSIQSDSYSANFSESQKLAAVERTFRLSLGGNIPEDISRLFETVQGLRLPNMRASRQSFYDILANFEEIYLEAYKGRDEYELNSAEADFIKCRAKILSELVYFTKENRLGIFGSGKHTKALLFLCPELFRYQLIFYNSFGEGSFLGEQVKSLENLETDPPDILIYSSREFEDQMYLAARHVSTRHIVLYNKGLLNEKTNI